MATTYTLISSNVLSGSAASVTFSSIPSTYTDLVVKYSLRSTATGTGFDDFIGLALNGSSSAVYGITRLYGNGATASSNRTTSGTYFNLNVVDGAGNTANTFTSGELYIPSYIVAQNKPISSFKVDEQNATTAYIYFSALLFADNTAISSLTIDSKNGGQFVSGSSFYLYGIKNS